MRRRRKGRDELSRGALVILLLLLAWPSLLWGQGLDSIPPTCGLEQRFGPGREECLSDGPLGTYRPVASALPVGGVGLQPLALSTYFRSAYPMDRDNGAVWAGRGFSEQLQGGVAGSWRMLRFALYPTVTWSQNRSFATASATLSGFSPYIYPWDGGRIDWPQRPGASSVTTWTAGQSYAELAGPWGSAVGVSNENVWWGPSRRYPLLLGVSAPGFPHAYANLRAPLPVLGDVTLRFLVGRLQGSGFFRTDTAREHDLLAALRVEWAPRGPSGPQFSVTSMTQQRWTGLGTLKRLTKLVPTRTAEDTTGRAIDGFGAVTALLPIAAIDARLFGTWGRGDFWQNTTDLITEPDHSQFWQVGFVKSWKGAGSNRPWTVSAEYASTAASAPDFSERGGGGPASVYLHPYLLGHTNDGQLLGASIGSGSRAGYVSLERGNGRRGWGALAERIDWDIDSEAWYLRVQYGPGSQDREDLLGGMYHGPLRVAGVQTLHLDAMGGVSLRWNRQYVRFTPGMTGYQERETNLWMDLRVVWTPGAGSHRNRSR